MAEPFTNLLQVIEGYIMLELQSRISCAIFGYTNDYIEKNGREDSGMCGSAVLLVSFGRRTKLKKLMIAEGVVNENRDWTSHGIKQYVVDLGRLMIGTQNINYYEGRAETAKALLEAIPELEGAEFYVHSWVD